MSATDNPKGKVALVTGSTMGIGLAIAHSLAKRGVNIILHGSRDRSLVSSTLEEIRSYGVRADYVACDLSKSSSIESLWTEVLNLYSEGIDILINNAAMGGLCHLENATDEKWNYMIALNLTAPFQLIKRSLPGMKKKGWGRIINMSSVYGLVGAAGGALYIATKHGLQGLTKGVALENAQYGITCNTINPGYVQTQMADLTFEQFGHSVGLSASDAKKAILAKLQPVGTIVESEQVAELVEFLCLSTSSSQMTGAAYSIDGGLTAQ